MDTAEINALIAQLSKDGSISKKDISDTRHTFGELYYQRMVLFCTILNLSPNISWKSKKHFDEENDPMFNGCFIAGINTPAGIATYHIKLKYWNLFQIPEVERAPKYDSYNSDDVLKRILSLTNNSDKN